MEGKHLNAKQQEAVSYFGGPLLVVAGAGTGKTTVIVEKIKHLIGSGFCKPQEILALTFTDKAAAEMQIRLDEVMPLGYTRLWIMTFHKFCETLLKDHALDIGLDPDFKILTAVQAVTLLKKNIFEFNLDYYRPLGNPHKFLSAMINFFSRLRDENISDQEFLSWSKQISDEKYKELALAFEKYTLLKQKLGVLDFGDLIFYVNQLFFKRPDILKTYQEKFKYFLVDEFQDTNFSQIELIKKLINAKQNLMLVADDDQAIYQWRGAAAGNVMDFAKQYSNLKIITLNENYRSTQNILDSAYKLINFNNPDRLESVANIDKRLISNKGLGETAQVLFSDSAEGEADVVAEKILELQQQIPELEFKDFAILVRANNQAEVFVKALESKGIPVQFLGTSKLFLQPEIKDLIVLLRVFANPRDEQLMYRVLNMPFWNLGGITILEVMTYAKDKKISLYDSLNNFPLTKKLFSLINGSIEKIHKQSPGKTLYEFLDESEILKSFLSSDSHFNELQVRNISKFFSKIKQFEDETEDFNLLSLLEWIDVSLELGESPTASTEVDWSLNNVVNILTYHSAKGLEFPVVFMVNLVSGRFPSINRKDPIEFPLDLLKEKLPVGDSNLQEERRLFYVGMTRAKNHLYLTYAKNYSGSGLVRKVSPFINEALGDYSATEHRFITNPYSHETTKEVTVSTNNKIKYITYSQIETFLDCPLHYKAKYILNLPVAPSASSSFGNTIHKTLQDYFKNKQQDIFKIYKNKWISEGFESAEHEKLFFEKGIKYLQGFMDNPEISKPKPLLLEENFKVFLGDLTVAGKIDRVDDLGQGKIEIIDYKTSPKIISEKEAKNNLQLSIYGLAALLMPESPFGKKPEEIVLTLYYLDNQTKVSTTRTWEELEVAKEKILDYVKQIETSDFACSGSFVCQKCDFSYLCDQV